MVKNIGNSILLFFFFVLVILILQITNKRTKSIDGTTEIPKSTSIIIRLNQNSFAKKVLLSVLYNPNKNNSLKQLYEKVKNTEDQSPQTYDQSLETFLSNINFQEPLEIISMKKNEEDLVFIRQRNKIKVSKKHLYCANNHLYLQLNHLDWEKTDIKMLLQENIKVKFPKSTMHDIEFYRYNNEKLSLSGNININNDGISIYLPKSKKERIRNELKSDGLHLSISNHENLLPFLKDEETDNDILSLSINYFGLNTYDSPIFFPNADFLFEFQNEIATQDFINYFSSEFFNNPNFSYIADSINKESGTLNIDDIAFQYKKMPPNYIFIGSPERTIHIEKTNKSIELSGDLYRVFNFDEDGWKGRLAMEIITSVPFLNQLNVMLNKTRPISTIDDNQDSRIDIKFNHENSTFIELINLISSII